MKSTVVFDANIIHIFPHKYVHRTYIFLEHDRQSFESEHRIKASNNRLRVANR